MSELEEMLEAISLPPPEEAPEQDPGQDAFAIARLPFAERPDDFRRDASMAQWDCVRETAAVRPAIMMKPHNCFVMVLPSDAFDRADPNEGAYQQGQDEDMKERCRKAAAGIMGLPWGNIPGGGSFWAKLHSTLSKLATEYHMHSSWERKQKVVSETLGFRKELR